MRLILALTLLLIAGAASAQMILFSGGQVSSGAAVPQNFSLLLVNGTDNVLLVDATDNLCLAGSSSC